MVLAIWPPVVWVTCTVYACMQVLLLKGANKLARNKKGRKPGDVFSPTVEEEKKERIKGMLGMSGDSVPVPTRSGVGSRPHPPSESSVQNKVGFPLCSMALQLIGGIG